MQKSQWFLPSRGVLPPFPEPKNVTNQQFYKETFAQKKEVVFCFVFLQDTPIFLYIFFKDKI